MLDFKFRHSGSAVVAKWGKKLAQKLTRPKNDRTSDTFCGALAVVIAVILS